MSSANPPSASSEDQLLEEGARSYLDALTALVEFRRQVRDKCKQVLERRLPEFRDAFGVELDPQRIKIWLHDGDNFNGTDTVLGVRLDCGFTPREWAWRYFGLGWEKHKDDPLWFGVYIALEVSSARIYRPLRERFTRVQVKEPYCLLSDSNPVWFSTDLTPTDMADLTTKLDNTLAAWIDLWRQAGSMSTLLTELE